MYPFARMGVSIPVLPSTTPAQTTPTKEQSRWEWLSKDDPDIVMLNSTGINMDWYIRDTIIQATHYLAEKVIENPKYALRYFDTLINVFEKECIDEVVLIEIVKAARKVIMSDVKLIITMDPLQAPPYSHSSQGNRSKLIGRLQERMPPGFDQASSELLGLAYDYLKNVTEVKDHHKKILNYTLLQLKNRSLVIRSKFFSLFDQYYGKSVYKRLQHIFFQPIWELSRDSKESFWIQQALDLLLSSIDEDVPMQREPDGVVLLSFHGKPVKSEAMADTLPSELERIISDNAKVVEKLSSKKTKYWLRPLKDVTNWEHHICEKLWLKLFPQFWNVMTGDEQQQIASLIEPFLAKEEFLKQLQGRRPNPLRTMFEAVSACDPMPKLAPEIIQYIGKNYGAWHTALPLLESYLYAYPGNERYPICMNVVFKNLVETEYIIGLQRYISKCPITHAALGYAQFQMWNSVDDLLSGAITRNIKLTSGKESIREIESSDFAHTGEDINKALGQMDLRIWEEWQTEAALNLNQWDMLKSLGAHTHKMSLTLQYYWSIRDWANFTTTSKKVGNSDTPIALLAQLYDRIQQSTNEDDPERDIIYKKGLKALYTEWNMLPSIVDAPHYQSIIVQQHFLETSEFKNMCKEVKDYLQRPVESDFKSPLNSWRERLPNKCEPFTVWRDLLECRNFLFKQLIEKLSSNPKLEKMQNYLQDTPWNYLKLAEVARKHSLIDQALHYLGEADRYLRDGGDVYNYEKFLRAKETAKIAMKFDNEWGEAAEYLKYAEKQTYCKKSPIALSEIMRLRGKLLHKIRNHRDAYDEMSTATSVCVHNYKAWETFAVFCEMGYESKQQLRYNAFALKGHINSAIYMLSNSKYYIPRILSCLEKDGASPATGESPEDSALKIFMDHVGNLPTWVWLYWLPQLFANLGRSQPEHDAARLVLKNIAKLYPQPLFLQLRRIQEKINNPTTKESMNEKVIAAVKDLWDKLQENERDGQKFECIEKMLNELENKVLTSFNKEDELLLHLKQLYTMCIPVLSAKTFARFISQISTKYFESNKEVYLELQKLYKDKFLNDFSKEAIEGRPFTESVRKLRNWVDYLHTKVTLRTEQYSIDGYSQELASYIPKKIEMFGANYQKDSEPTPESTVYIARLETKVEKTYQRTRVDFRGTNEKTYNYYLQNYNENEKNEVLISQLRHYLNHIFASSRHTMARNVKLYSPYSLYWGRMKMTLDEFHVIPMSDLHDAALVERGFHPEHASSSYLEQYAQTLEPMETSETYPSSEKELRKSVIEEMRYILGDYVFAGFIHKLVSNPDELFIYKKQFTSYLAAQAFFSYIFKAGHGSLNTLMFCKRSGKIYYSNYQLNTIGAGESSKNESPVPFRLTPNLQYFITPIGIEGPFAGAITAAAYSLQRKKLQYFAGYLWVFYKDLLEDPQDPDAAKYILPNHERTLKNAKTLLDNEEIKKVFNSRHAVFKTETVKTTEPGTEERKEGEKVGCFNQEVYNKIKEAQDPAKLNEMPLAWAPWFQT
eukprot:TRINITY_DN35190_c0_g2_i1.p1 TRINITY_DN35190_c0_g2~~TRINITY_DN35190_c0_g2_i1.p1  ORF type:complete len:1518 (-),score=185.51 TRINITY_DN35190_c0_g2_i1:79-4632(-)